MLGVLAFKGFFRLNGFVDRKNVGYNLYQENTEGLQCGIFKNNSDKNKSGRKMNEVD